MSAIQVGQLRDDPIIFSKNVLRIKLHEGQKKILECKDRFIVVRAARRFGKSYVFAAFTAWAISVQPNYRVIVVSKVQRQSKEMFEKIKGIITNSLLASSIVRCTQTELVLSNGSMVQSLPGSSRDTLRSLTADMVLIDEAAYVEEATFGELYPIITSTQGRMILISTPGFNSGEFYRACQDNSEFTTFHFTHADAVWEDGKPFLPPEELEREAIRCGGVNSAEYAREYLAEFGSAEGAFFDFQAIEESLRDDLPVVHSAEEGHTYVTGVDVGQINDFTVITTLDITDPDCITTAELIRFNGESTDAIIARIHDSAFRFNSKKVLIDEGNIGRSIIEHLKIKHPNSPYYGFNFNVSTKPRVMMNLSIVLNRRQLLLPDDIDVQKEMMSFRYIENPRTKNISMGGANGVHDDIPISLALAIEAADIFRVQGTVAIGFGGRIYSGAKKEDERHRASKNKKRRRVFL